MFGRGNKNGNSYKDYFGLFSFRTPLWFDVSCHFNNFYSSSASGYMFSEFFLVCAQLALYWRIEMDEAKTFIQKIIFLTRRNMITWAQEKSSTSHDIFYKGVYNLMPNYKVRFFCTDVGTSNSFSIRNFLDEQYPNHNFKL